MYAIASALMLSSVLIVNNEYGTCEEMGRRSKELNAAIEMILECGFTSIDDNLEEVADGHYTRSHVESAKLLLLKKMFPNRFDPSHPEYSGLDMEAVE